jgi:hypothetical protein
MIIEHLTKKSMFQNLEGLLGKPLTDEIEHQFNEEYATCVNRILGYQRKRDSMYPEMVERSMIERSLMVDYLYAILKQYVPKPEISNDPRQGKLFP